MKKSQVLNRSKYKERLAGLKPEEQLIGLKPEELLQDLSKLAKGSHSTKGFTLPPETQGSFNAPPALELQVLKFCQAVDRIVFGDAVEGGAAGAAFIQ